MFLRMIVIGLNQFFSLITVILSILIEKRVFYVTLFFRIYQFFLVFMFLRMTVIGFNQFTTTVIFNSLDNIILML